MRSLLLNHRRRLFVISVFILLLIITGLFLRSTQHELLITFLDVGQGDAVLLTAPNGNRLLYDAGPPTGAVVSALGKELGYFDHDIAIMVASHPDADHIGGFADLFARYTPKLYLDAHTYSSSEDFEVLEKDLKQRGVERRTLPVGSKIDLGSGVFIDVLAPERSNVDASINGRSLVLHVHYGAMSLLLTGDLEQDGESSLIERLGNRLHATILKAGHHGSKTSTSERFLDAVDPQLVIISAGAHNIYGHPHQSTLARLQSRNIEILQTAMMGNIHFSCSPIRCALLK